MSYKTILVNFSGVDRVSALMDVAVGVAKRYSAHIIGLHVVPPFNVISLGSPFGVSPELIAEYRKSRQKLSGEIEAEYKRYLEAAGVSAEWRCVDALENWGEQHLIKHARCADLIISAQGEPDDSFSEEARVTERLIMEAARPVLVVPNEGSFETVGKYPVVAWNASREAVRAAFDALPFLEDAYEVKAVWVDPDEPDEKIDVAGSEIATTFSRHGVKVEAASLGSGPQKIGATLLDQVRDHAGDLLVMGAYGHSRVREFIFGGATKSVLKNMTIPVLMSH